MSDDLRTRIAAALRSMSGDLTYEAMADAVIRELGLQQEWGIAERGEPEPGVLNFDRSKIAKYVHDGDTMMHRWITDWKADD